MASRSTVISLIERFYDPLSGRITVDGHDVSRLNVAAYRSRIALVAQESALYSGSVRTNVLLGSDRPADEVSQEELEAACRAAKCAPCLSSAVTPRLRGRTASTTLSRVCRTATTPSWAARVPSCRVDSGASARLDRVEA